MLKRERQELQDSLENVTENSENLEKKSIEPHQVKKLRTISTGKKNPKFVLGLYGEKIRDPNVISKIMARRRQRKDKIVV